VAHVRGSFDERLLELGLFYLGGGDCGLAVAEFGGVGASFSLFFKTCMFG
jgi:hypothetical protein